MPQALETLLRESPFLAGLGDGELELLAGCGRNVRFVEGEYLFHEGDPAETFFILRAGSVALELFVPARRPAVIETLEAGDVIGWSWLFPPYRWHFDARAARLVRGTAFDGACLRAKCAENPAFGYDLMGRFAQVLIERLQSTRLRLLDVYGDNAGR